MVSLEIVVFANSYKNSFHCVAGKTTANKKWVRPVSDVMGGELNHKQIEYKNPYGKYPVKTLQIINLIEKIIKTIKKIQIFYITKRIQIVQNKMKDF